MAVFQVHIIHVGSMSNKGTQALLQSDISAIKDIVSGNVTFSVSTTDTNGVRLLNPFLTAVSPPMVDIPYEKADLSAKKLGFGRNSLTYKAFALGSLFFMSIQALSSIFSAVLVKANLRGLYRGEVLKRIKDCDIVISYSDENFKEMASLLPSNIYWLITWWSVLISRTWEILIAKFLGKPVVMFPNSVGPFRTWMGRFLARLALNNCSYVLVREPVSYQVVKSLGIKSPQILTSDTTLLFRPNHKMVFESPFHPVIGVSAGFYSHSLSQEEARTYIVAHAQALDKAIEKHGFFVIFLPHYISGFSSDDLEICERIIHEMKNGDQSRIIKVDTVDEFKSILDQMDMVISSKMHPAVLAVSGYVPTLCIAYDHKQTGFFEGLGMRDCILPVSSISHEKLLSSIDYVWSKRDEKKALLKERVPALKEDIRNALKQTMASFLT